MRRRLGVGATALAASAGANLLLFIALAWAQATPTARPRPQSYVVREVFQAPPPPPEAVEPPDLPVDAEDAPPVVEPEPLEPAPAAERFDARLDLPRPDLPAPGLPEASAGAPLRFGANRGARPPRRATAPLPPYPAWARARRLQGVVTLRVEVGADGAVRTVEVERVEGDPRFADVARDAVRAWTFEPAVRDGRPVDGVLIQRVRFEMVD